MKKGSKEWLAAEQQLKREALTLQQRSLMLKENAIKICHDIEEFDAKYPEDILDSLPWDIKEQITIITEQLLKRLEESSSWLSILEAEQRDLARRANEFYGYEIMHPVKNVPDSPKEYEEPDPADWWKTT